MSTFPRRVKEGGTIAQPVLTRPTSDFDAGLNSSAAWTEHLDLTRLGDDDSLSISDDGTEKNASINVNGENRESFGQSGLRLSRGQPARVLYDFSGESVANELTVLAGNELEILRETIEGAEGWSLARIPLRIGDYGSDDEDEESEDDAEREGKVGLVPREYYAFTTDFVSSPLDEITPIHGRDASTPRASANPSRPLIPQNTGEWFRNQVRRSLLGGRSLNRFSRFVTSGAEAFILHGAPPSGPKATSANGKLESPPDGLPSAMDFRLSIYAGYGHSREPSVVPPEADHDAHSIEVDDAGPMWCSKVPSFDVCVRSPEKRFPSGLGGGNSDVGAYIVYSVTSTFSSPSASSTPEGTINDDGNGNDGESDSDDTPRLAIAPQIITVQRRFSHFVLLHNALSGLLPGLALPPLPEKQYAGRMNAAFVEARRSALQRYLRHLVKHPIVRYAEPLTFFLSCEDEVEWRRQLAIHLGRAPLGASFFANVFHLPFQVDAEETADVGERFENHTRAVARGVQQLRDSFGKVRNARLDMSNAERFLSYSILSLITSRPLSSPSALDYADESEDEECDKPHSPISPNGRSRRHCRTKKGLQNADGAWCWREDCSDCLRLTKCMQKTAETLQGVADLFDGHARRTMLETEDSLKDAAHPDTIYAPILDIHRETLDRYKESSDSILKTSSSRVDTSNSAVQNNGDDDNVAARCETVLNTTLSEFDQYHSQKIDNFERITKAHLDGEIAFYEKVLARLRTTRALFDTDVTELALTMPGARTASIYERELCEPRIAEPLSHLAPHVLDSTGPSMRPVSAAIQGLLGIGAGAPDIRTSGLRDEGSMLGENGENRGRSSVFSRLW